MFDLYKPTWKRAGKRGISSHWYIRIEDHHGKRHKIPADESEDTSRQMGQRIDDLIRCRKTMETPDARLLRWIEVIPRALRERLIDADIIDTDLAAKDQPLLVWLEGQTDASGAVTFPGYRQHLVSTGDTAEHVEQTVRRIRRVLEGCGFVHFRDLCREGAARLVETYLSKLRTEGEKTKHGRLKKIGGQTVNYHIQAVRSFASWMRPSAPPLAGLHRVRGADVDRQETRTLAPEEMRCLIAAADPVAIDRKSGKQVHAGTTWRGFAPADRALLYRFAYETGMRPGQIRQLTVSCFDLDADPPTVTSKAATVKRRKPQTQALRAGMAEDLRRHLASKTPEAKAFAMPDKFLLARMFRFDLAAARAAWIKEAEGDEPEQIRRQKSDFLADVDHAGLRAMFYTLRHSHGTSLGDANIPQKDIQASLHHTRSATTDRYLKAGLLAKAKAVNALPDVRPGPKWQPLAAQATGTHGRPTGVHEPLRMSGACSTAEILVESHGADGDGPAQQKTLGTAGDTAVSKGLSQRARRGSNPQPPDRQSGTLTN